MATKIQLRRDLAASWTSSNPILAQGEPGLETDTGKIKYGNGTTHWADLDYAASGGVVDGNLDVGRATQGSITTLNFNAGTNYGYMSHDVITRSNGNLYLAGGFYSSTANNDGYTNEAPLLTKVDASGNVIVSKFIYETSQYSWSHAAGVTVNPTTGNITLAGSSYFAGPYVSELVRHEISADLTTVTSTRYSIPDKPWAYTQDSVLAPDGTTVIVGGHGSGIDVTYSNVQPHPGSYTGYLGLNITETFGSNSLPTIHNGWYITGYNTGGTDITSVNDFIVYGASSSTSADGYNDAWEITYTPKSNVYVVSDFSGGLSFLTGDVLTIFGNELGGNISTNDLTITVGNVDGRGTILDFVTSGPAQTDLIWLHENSGIDFGNLPPGEQWNVLQSTGENGWVMSDSWVKSVGGDSYDTINGVATDLGGNIYLGGQMQSGQSYRGNRYAGVVKLDSSGVLQWTKFVDYDHYNSIEQVAVDSAGNVVVVGRTNSSYMFVGKMNPTTGSMYWRTTIGTDGTSTSPMGFNTMTNPVFAADGNIIVAGSFGSIVSQADDIFVASFNTATGNVLWQRAISASGNQDMTWNDGHRALASDGANYYVSYFENINHDYPRLIKLPADGTEPGDLVYNITYWEQDWLTGTVTNPTIANDDGRFIQVSTETWTPHVLTTSLIDTLTYATASTTDLYKGATGYVKGVTHIDFEDGTQQDSAAITQRSTFAGTNYDTMDIRIYNGGLNFYWDGSTEVEWFNSDNAPDALTGLMVTGAIIEYQIYDNQHYGTQIGTIHASGFYDQSGEAAHTEHWTSNDNDMMYNQPWHLANGYNRVRLMYRGKPSESAYIKIQWTARVFYGQENNC